MTTTPGPGGSADHRAQLEAAEQNMALFAREAVLALDEFERSIPAGGQDGSPDRARQVGERFIELWRQYGLDEVTFSPDSSDPERILMAAAKVAGTENSDGLSLQNATYQAELDAREAGARPLTESVARLRSDLTESLGESFSPPQPGVWLEQSLARLAKASVLRDAVRLGAKAQGSEQTQEAVDQFVRQGQLLMDNQRTVSAGTSALADDRQDFFRRQVNRAMVNFGYTTGVLSQDPPAWASMALTLPVSYYLLARMRAELRQRTALQQTVQAGQQQLRSVRSDLAGSLDKAKAPGKPDPLGSRDTRGVLGTRRDGPGRGRGR